MTPDEKRRICDHLAETFQKLAVACVDPDVTAVELAKILWQYSEYFRDDARPPMFEREVEATIALLNQPDVSIESIVGKPHTKGSL